MNTIVSHLGNLLSSFMAKRGIPDYCLYGGGKADSNDMDIATIKIKKVGKKTFKGLKKMFDKGF